MNKSITIVGDIVDFVYVIKDINVDKITLEKYLVRCRTDIESAWEDVGSNDKIVEVTLEEKISTVTLIARANVVEVVATMGGKIIKDIVVERVKRGKKVYMSGIILFKENRKSYE